MKAFTLLCIIALIVVSCSRERVGVTKARVVQPPGDTCQSAPVVTPKATLMTIDGRTTGRANDYRTTYDCGDRTNSAPDVVVAVNMPAGGILDAQVYATSSGFNPAIYVRDDCAIELYCADYGPLSEVFRADLPPGIHYVIVDGAAGSAGSFRLFLSVAAPSCGDGIVSAGEQCDPGEPVQGDGCGDPGTANECQAEAPDPAAEAPPGLPLTLSPGTNYVAGTTLGYTDNASGTCSPFGPGADRFYQWTAPANGVIDVWLGYTDDGVTPACENLFSPYCWDRVVYLLQWNGTAWAQPAPRTAGDVSCSDVGYAQMEHVHRTVIAGEPYVIGVDGYDPNWYSQGMYNMRIDLQ
jgi:cysteine-rich repeat protein